MNPYLRITALLAVVAASGCTTIAWHKEQDAMCRHIASFAKAATGTSKHSIELVTDWSKFSKSCTHDNYAPGMELCSWLMPNTSTEFMHVNINSALRCLGPGNPSDLAPSIYPDYASGSYTSFKAKYVGPDYEVQVEFSTGVEGRPESLKISAGRSE